MNAQYATNPVHRAESVSYAANELVDAVTAGAVDCVRRSTVVRRLSEGSLPFAGRAAWLEQHWEGLRILRDCAHIPTAVRGDLITVTGKLSHALDRAHAGARWRDQHVTMPSMLTFRRHITGLRDSGDVLGLTAQAYLRLLCSGIGSGVSGAEHTPDPVAGLRELLCGLVGGEEDLERLSEELSAGLLMFMQHGSDVCRAYQSSVTDESCAVTVATIRGILK